MSSDGIRDEIERLEDRIEGLRLSVARCRKISVAAKAAIAGGFAWLALTFLLIAPFWPSLFFGAIAAYSAYNWLLRHVSAEAIGTTAYVNPAVAVALGALWGEKIGPAAVGAMALILAGVWLLKRENAAIARRGAPAEPVCEPA